MRSAAARPPAAACSADGGRDVRRRRSDRGDPKPFATGVTAPPVPLQMPRSRRRRGTFSSPARGCRRQPSRASTTRTWRRFRTDLADAGKAVGTAAAAGAYMRMGDHFDDVVPFTRCRRAGRVRADRGDAGGRHEAPVRAHRIVAVRVPAARPGGDDQQGYAEDLAELQAYGRFDSAVRTAEQTETVRFHTGRRSSSSHPA